MSYRDDDELGFVGAVASAVPAAMKGIASIGKIFKKKKKKKPHKIQMEPTNIVGEVKKASEAARGSVKGTVQAVVASIPGPVREVVLEALKAQQLEGAAKERQMKKLAKQVDASLKPKIATMLATLKAQELSKKATFEHKKLVDEAKFKDSTLGMLRKAFDKLDAIEARLGMSTVIPPGKSKVFGSRNVLEGR